MVESLAHNSLKAASWLDHWLDAVDQVVGKETPQKLRDMLCNGGKVIRYIASQSASWWVSSLLMRRDAVLPRVQSLPRPEATSSDFLSPALLSLSWIIGPVND